MAINYEFHGKFAVSTQINIFCPFEITTEDANHNLILVFFLFDTFVFLSLELYYIIIVIVIFTYFSHFKKIIQLTYLFYPGYKSYSKKIKPNVSEILDCVGFI